MSDQIPLLEEIGDPTARHEEDFYATPGWMTRALLRRLYLARWVVCEPCVGDGAILRYLPDDITAVTNDIVARFPVIPHFALDASRPDSWKWFEQRHGPIDLTLTNPPFDEAFEIIQQAVKRSTKGVVCLLRCTWIEPTDDRGEWLAKHPPDAQIVLPRWNFRSLDGKGGGDSAPASWFIWNRQIELVPPGIHVVSKSERDKWIALEKGKPT